MPEPRQSAAEKPGAPRIEFESVRFAYPDAGEDAVEGVSFSIQPGQTLGNHRRHGLRQKATLVRLLTRDYDVTGGAVRVDGTDVREYTSRRLHAKIGLVPQAAQLFSGTVRSNLQLGAENAPDSALWKALGEVAQGADFCTRASPTAWILP